MTTVDSALDMRGSAVKAVSRPGRSSDRGRIRGHIATITAWVAGIVFVLPVLLMIFVSFHSDNGGEATLNPIDFSAPFTFEGYAKFFGSQSGQSPIPFLLNSVAASVVSTVIVLALAIPASYALAVRKIRRWTDVMFFFLSTKFLPVAAGLVPLYVIALQIHALDHVWFLIILYTAMNLPIAVWMMRSFMADIPVALFEAASLDGAGLAKTLLRVATPIAMPGIAATSLICFIFSWNELLYATLLTSTNNAQTLPVLLVGLQGSTGGGTFVGAISAAALLVSIPVLVAGFAAQDKLVQGLSMGAVK